jgi:regulator of sigma E protease
MSEKPVLQTASLKTYSRVVLLAAIAVAAVVLIVRNMGVSKNILLVLLGFGAVILIHEFGHFIVAKLCGIKVEAFSIFMPPILLGIKKADRGWRIRILPELLREEGQNSEDGPASASLDAGRGDGLLSFTVGKKILPGETEYRIGLIPFGGFVKMLGQDDTGPIKTSSDPRSFANKPAWARAAVFAAGVTFNAISAVIVYIIVFLVGINLSGPTVGGVIPGSPADKAGIRPGDEVIEIAGEDGRLDFSDVMMAGVLSAKGQAIPLKVRHENGKIEDILLAAEQMPGEQFRIFGIQRAYSLTIAKLFAEDANQLLKTTGLMPGDRIKAVAGVDVNSHWQLQEIVQQTFSPDIAVLAERPPLLSSDGKTRGGQIQLVEGRLALDFESVVRTASESEADLSNICSMVPRLRITEIFDEPRSVKEWLSRRLAKLGLARPKAGDDAERLKPADIIVAVADVENPTYSELRQTITAYKGKTLPITVLRADANGIQQRLTVPVVPRKESDSERVVIGIAPELDTEHPVVAKAIATEKCPKPIVIPRGAAITAVDGVAVSSFYDVARELKKNADQRVTINWRLNDQTAGNVAIDVGKQQDVVDVRAYFKQAVPFVELERLYKADGPIDAIGMGYKRTKTFIIQTYVTLHRLIGGLVSPKQLMGPVGILTFSYRIVAAQPLIYYAYFLGLISASIAVLNFLPLPPFDGGLTLLLLVEKIKGSSLSVRTQEIIAYAGWGLVGALLLYVTFNDIVRSVFG